MIKKILYYLRIVFLGSGFLLLIAALILDKVGNTSLADLFLLLSSILGILGFASVMVYIFCFALKDARTFYQPEAPKEKKIKTVDVKDIPKTKEEKLYEEYEKLYKKNLITKEDLDAKRKELLGK